MIPDLSRELARFIRYDTVSSRSNAAFARVVGERLRESGFKVSYQSAKKDRLEYLNVIGIKGRGARPLLLCSHLDTVPAGDMKKWTRTDGNPWKAKTAGGKLYGLGAADDKGPLAAMLGAVSGVRASDLRRPLMFMGTFGEESGMGGAKTFCRRWKGPKPLLAVVGEPTDLGITYRHKGMGVLVIELTSKKRGPRAARPHKVVFKGRSGHSSRPWLGDNALDKAVRFLRSRRALPIAALEGGHAANVIPDHARLAIGAGGVGIPAAAFLDVYDAVQVVVKSARPRADRTFRPAVLTSNFGVARVKNRTLSLTFDFRLLPGQSFVAIFRSLQRLLCSTLRPHRGIRFKIFVERNNSPLDQRAHDALPRFGRRLLRAEGLPVRLDVKPACTEAGIYASWGVPAVIFGPGRSAGNIHAPNECVRVKDLAKAARFYARVVEEICVKESPCS